MPHAHQVQKAKGTLHISRGGGTPPLPHGGGWVGVPLYKTPFSALYLPTLAPKFTESGQEEAGKGLKIPFRGGNPLHATPFRQETAIN